MDYVLESLKYVLESLDYADFLCLLPENGQTNLNEEARKVDLKINMNKTEVLCLTNCRISFRIGECINKAKSVSPPIARHR